MLMPPEWVEDEYEPEDSLTTTSEAVKPPSSCDAGQAAGERRVMDSYGPPPWASRLAGIDLRGAGRRSDQRQRRSRARHPPHHGKRRNLPARPSAPRSAESSYYEPATATPSSVPSSGRSSINWAAKHSSSPAESQAAPVGPPRLNSTPARSQTEQSPGSTTGPSAHARTGKAPRWLRR